MRAGRARRGATNISLEVLIANEDAVAVWRRLGFVEHARSLSTPLDTLAARLEHSPAGESRAVTHVQSDDGVSVERAVGHFIPKLEAPAVTAHDSWIRIADPLLDRDREAHGRFARELSERLGAVTVALALEGEVVRFRLYERGRMVDEYLSVPTYYGPLPKGDELALAANPTLVARLTGADRDAVKRVARSADSPGGAATAQGALRAGCAPDGAGAVKLYDAARCPYCARVRIAMAEKSLVPETVEIDLSDRPAWVYELNPSGRVPVA